jgi:hypothetical protein
MRGKADFQRHPYLVDSAKKWNLDLNGKLNGTICAVNHIRAQIQISPIPLASAISQASKTIKTIHSL